MIVKFQIPYKLFNHKQSSDPNFKQNYLPTQDLHNMLDLSLFAIINIYLTYLFKEYKMIADKPQESMLNRSSSINTDGSTDTTFFIFINSGSGGGLGAKIIEQEIRQIQFEIPVQNQTDIRLFNVYFINLLKNKQYGFKKLKKLNDRKKRTIAVVCGGDGTVMWVVGQFVNFGIDPMQTPIVIIPTGTGNDFSRCLRWGPEKTMLLQHNYRSLKKLIRKWVHAKQSEFDLWDMTAEVFSNGKFEKVKDGENVIIKSQSVKKTFVNYFSFGIDGKIGYSFDMHRTTSRIGNLAMYGMIGVAKSTSATKTIDQLVESFYVKSHKSAEQTCVFKSRFQTDKFEQHTQYITPGLQNILMLNIDSYAGGVEGIWQSAQELFTGKTNQRTPSAYNDGKLQVLSFPSGIALAMERSIGGFGNRVDQNEGPFIFNFRAYPDEEKHRTYLQIDGEYIRFTHPKRVTIQKSTFIKNGKIKVLVNDPNFVPYMPEN